MRKQRQKKKSEAGEILGLGKLTSEQAAKLRETLGLFMALPKSKLAKLIKEDTLDG